jgi:leukotriene-A4 hydrolase
MNHTTARVALACVAGLAAAALSSHPGAASPVAGAAGPRADLAPIQSGLDYHSFANIEQFKITHIELNLRADFRNKVLFGEAALEVKRLDPGASELVLDTRDLDVRDVSEKPSNVMGALSKSETTWVSRPFHLDRADPVLGSPLVIDLPPSRKSTEIIKIEYVTSPGAPSLHWLDDKQTGGKHHPFMYTLSAPIGARGWMPVQDTPLARITFSASIHTDRDLLAVMTARNDPNVKHNGEYSFVMRDAIPPGLIGLAIGDLRFKPTGPRSGVYAEKPLVSDAVKELADTESLMQAAEKMFGPYRFERYDVVIMPPAFPVAELGFPRAAFVSPTAVPGDRSREAIVARALAESWAGDLVSGASARDAWINAGLATYMQERIVEAAYGAPRATTERVLEDRSLREDLERMSAEDQVLAVDLRGRDPGVGMREAPDRKAALLFGYLDGKFGRERFDAFLRGFFDHFAFKSITTEQFLAYLKENLLDRSAGTVTAAEVSAWVTGPGLPRQAPLANGPVYEEVDAVRDTWLAGRTSAKKLDTHGWVTPQWVYFLGNMPTLRKEQLAELDQTFGFTRSPNAEIASSWFLLVIRAAYQPSYPRLEEFLETTGRRSLITPLYVELMKTPAGEALARRVFPLARPLYQAQTAAALDAIVNAGSDSSDDE